MPIEEKNAKLKKEPPGSPPGNGESSEDVTTVKSVSGVKPGTTSFNENDPGKQAETDYQVEATEKMDRRERSYVDPLRASVRVEEAVNKFTNVPDTIPADSDPGPEFDPHVEYVGQGGGKNIKGLPSLRRGMPPLLISRSDLPVYTGHNCYRITWKKKGVK